MIRWIEIFVLYESEEFGPVPVEPLGGDRYRLWSKEPLSDLDFGNIVEGTMVGPDRLRVHRVVEQGGWRTVATGISRELQNSPALQALLDRWEQEGLHWERMMGGLLFIHIPPGRDFDPWPEIEALGP